MSGNRKAAEEFILKIMKSLTIGGGNHTIYSNLFSAMNDKQFEDFIVKLEEGEQLPIYASNFDKKEMIDFDKVVAMCEKLGIEIMHRLKVVDPDTGIEYITPETYMVGVAEVRRQRQMLVKKFSYAKDDTQVSDRTGQVVGDSQAAGLSYPEIQILLGMGLIKTAQELYDVKGGDVKALEVYRNALVTTGVANTNESLKRGGGVKSLRTAHYLYRARHIDNNLDAV